MKADSCLSLCFRLLDHMDHFLQCHFCTVVDGADVLCVFQKLWIYQRSCIDHHICFLQILFSSYCDKIRCSRTCSYEMYHNLSFSFINLFQLFNTFTVVSQNPLKIAFAIGSLLCLIILCINQLYQLLCICSLPQIPISIIKNHCPQKNLLIGSVI